MKAVRNVALVVLLAAAPFALAHRGDAPGAQGAGPAGCPLAQGQTQDMQARRAEHQARMAALHQGMGPGMRQGMQPGFGPRFGQPAQPEDKK